MTSQKTSTHNPSTDGIVSVDSSKPAPKLNRAALRKYLAIKSSKPPKNQLPSRTKLAKRVAKRKLQRASRKANRK